MAFSFGGDMSDGCREFMRDTCAGCEIYGKCEKTKGSASILESIVKSFEVDHPGQRYRKSYGKSKRKSAARLKMKR